MQTSSDSDEATYETPLDALREGAPTPITVGGRTILLWRLGDHVAATMARCTHQGAPLIEGRWEGPIVECPWHAVRFDVRTGARLNPPKCRDLKCYPTSISDGMVRVTVTRLPGRQRANESVS